MVKIISVEPLEANSFYQIVGVLPRCQWQEAMVRCTNQASLRIITDEDRKEFCRDHYELYKKRYCRRHKQTRIISKFMKFAKGGPR